MENPIIIKENSILITESTVLEWYMKITNNHEITPEEQESILKRFKELVNCGNTNGTRIP